MTLKKIVFKIVSISFSILVMLLIVIGLIQLGTLCFNFGHRVFMEPPVAEAPGTDISVEVTSDMSEHDIGMMLKDKGLVRDGNLFYAQLKLSAYSGKLRAGTYTLNTSTSARDMMAVMATVPVDDTETEEPEGEQ